MDYSVVHFEIPADDPERASKFYQQLFGWGINKWEGPAGPGGAPMTYWMVSTVPTDEKGMPTRPGINGGIMKRMHPGQGPLNYVGVENADEFAKKAERLGAQVVMPKTAVSDMGAFILLKDTEGNIFGLWETHRR
jgi:predicted enzyme related to lactoylglutathione lyase